MDAGQLYRWDIPEEYHYDRWIAERSCALLEEYRNNQQPFFLWSSFFDPHPDYLAPPPWDTMYDNRHLTVPHAAVGEHDDSPKHHQLTQQQDPDFADYKETGYMVHGMHRHHAPPEKAAKNMSVYYGMVSLMDKYIGRILDKLDALGLTDDTLVVFTTDHGHFFGQHGLHAKGPFMYEDMVRIPMIARCPGEILPGSRTQALQSLVDIAPTLLNYAEVEIPYHMTGISQRPVWDGSSSKVRDSIICEHHHEPTAIQLRTYVDSRYKLTVYLHSQSGELYDLEQDPGELYNLWNSKEHAELRHRLLLDYIRADLMRECKRMPRIANA